MPQFWRIHNNQLYNIGEVNRLGWDLNSGEIPPGISYSYLNQNKFLIMRTCHGLGDWGIISGFPKMLKTHYPDCKVYIPSDVMLRKIFGGMESQWSSWDDPFQVTKQIFELNPYVDGFVDEWEGEVYHDHFRIYEGDEDEPLITQMARFWRIGMAAYEPPQLYFSSKTINLGDYIIRNYGRVADGYGTLLLSDRYNGEGLDKIQDFLYKNSTYPVFTWTSKPIEEYSIIVPRPVFDLRHVPIEVQLYIKSKAKFNIGNQTGVHDTIAAMAPTYTVPRGKLGSNIILEQHYL